MQRRSITTVGAVSAFLLTATGLAVYIAGREARLDASPVDGKTAAEVAGAVVALLVPGPPTRSAVTQLDAADAESRRRATNTLLSELGDALEDRDARAAARLVEGYFARGAPAVDDLFVALADRSLELDAAEALGVLVKAALHFTTLDPALLAPWQSGDLVEQCLAQIGGSLHAPRALLAGLDEYGARTEPRHVFALVDAFAGGDIDPSFEAEVPCLGLARRWAEDLPPAVEDALTTAVAEVDTSDSRRAQVAGMLLVRDWRRFAPDLAEALAARREASALSTNASLDVDFELVLSARIVDVQPMERGDYFAALGADQGLAVAMAWQLDAADARLALEAGKGAELEGDARALLEVRAESAAALESGRRLLAGGQAPEALERLVIGSWLASDLALGDELAAELGTRFEARRRDGGRFWRALNHDLRALADHELVAGVLPWLDRSRGEQDAARERLVVAVRKRLNDPRIE